MRDFLLESVLPWLGRGDSLQGFNSMRRFPAASAAFKPAFYLQEGVPQNFEPPPSSARTIRMGRTSCIVRSMPTEVLFPSVEHHGRSGARHGRSTEHGVRGQRRQTAPFEYGSPQRHQPELSGDGERARRRIPAGMTSLDGVPLPYPGWVEQMTCAPSVAQALRPFPQYCDSLARTERESRGIQIQRSTGEGRAALFQQDSTVWWRIRCRGRSRTRL